VALVKTSKLGNTYKKKAANIKKVAHIK